MLKKLWIKVSYLGIDNTNLKADNRQIVLANRINLISVLMIGFNMFITGIVKFFHGIEFTLTDQLLIVMMFMWCFNFWFSYKSWHLITRISLVIVPALITVVLPIFLGTYTYSEIRFSPIMLLLYSITGAIVFRADIKNYIYVFIVIFYIVLVLVLDNLIISFSKLPYGDLLVLREFQLQYKMAFLTVFVFVHAVLYYLQSINNKYEIRINEYIDQLESSNEEIEQQKEQLMQLNNELNNNLSVASVLKERLIEANNTKLKFFSIVSHDLKGPIGSLYVSAEYLKSKYLEMSPDKVKKFIYAFYNSADNLNKFVNNLLVWSKTQMNSIQVSKKEVKIFDIVDEIVNLYTPNFIEKKIYIVNEVDINHKIFVDRDLIITVIRNLINNALKYTSAGGSIWLKSIEKDSKIVFSIKDDGVGMSNETINMLFKTVKIQSTRGTNNEVGSGMGLMICNEFLKLNDSQITVESEVNVGTTFTIEFPK